MRWWWLLVKSTNIGKSFKLSDSSNTIRVNQSSQVRQVPGVLFALVLLEILQPVKVKRGCGGRGFLQGGSISISIYLSIYLSLYIYIYRHTHTHIYIYIYIYTPGLGKESEGELPLQHAGARGHGRCGGLLHGLASNINRV